MHWQPLRHKALAGKSAALGTSRAVGPPQRSKKKTRQKISTAFPHARTQEQRALRDSTCFFGAGAGEPSESHMHPMSRPAWGDRPGSQRSHRRVRSAQQGGRWLLGEHRGGCQALQHTSKSAKQKGKRRSYFKTTSSFIEKSLKEKAVPMRVALTGHAGAGERGLSCALHLIPKNQPCRSGCSGMSLSRGRGGEPWHWHSLLHATGHPAWGATPLLLLPPSRGRASAFSCTPSTSK